MSDCKIAYVFNLTDRTSASHELWLQAWAFEEPLNWHQTFAPEIEGNLLWERTISLVQPIQYWHWKFRTWFTVDWAVFGKYHRFRCICLKESKETRTYAYVEYDFREQYYRKCPLRYENSFVLGSSYSHTRHSIHAVILLTEVIIIINYIDSIQINKVGWRFFYIGKIGAWQRPCNYIDQWQTVDVFTSITIFYLESVFGLCVFTWMEITTDNN